MSKPKHQPIIIPALALQTSPSTESFSTDSSSSTYASCTSSPTTPSSPSNVFNLGLAQPQMPSKTRPQSRRGSPPQILLGAIDEHSSAVLPDIPYSPNNKDSPVTKLHVYAAVLTSRKKPTLATSQPPPNEYAALIGPNGERFMDLRMNRKSGGPKKNSLSRFMCFA